MPAPYRLAGRYSEPITDRYGNALLTASVAVYLPGSTTLATLFTDATKATTAANPVTSAGVGSKLDGLGNLTLYATPGEYDMVTTANGVTGATVRIVVPLAVDEAAQVGVVSPAATFTYYANGDLQTQTAYGVTITYTWNADGTLATETDGTTTRTYTYTAGNLTAVA